MRMYLRLLLEISHHILHVETRIPQDLIVREFMLLRNVLL